MISIFEQFIHLPGDNDIGGENGEYISNLNIHRFEENYWWWTTANSNFN